MVVRLRKYPDWICYECGTKYGKIKSLCATYHRELCPVCKKRKSVTQPRDFGYPRIPGFKY